ncbi:MAG: CPBP family intramembrane metalloprotease [Chlamydiae bacterium]|nr:CPBP family intramembrane metalloprotease [Chlamydiota bacterium]
MDNAQAPSLFSEIIESMLLFGILALVLNLIARSKGFFHLGARPLIAHQYGLGLSQVVTCFGIYLGYSLLFVPLLSKIIQHFFSMAFHERPPIIFFSWIQLITVTLTMISLYLYSDNKDSQLLKYILKNRSIPNPSSKTGDFVYGAMSWILGFPVAAFIGQVSDLAIYLVAGIQTYEQVAVKYLKMTIHSPIMLCIALFTILIAAPVTEEFLFRGMLQSWLKKKMGTKPAIITASLAFALFHLSASQGLGNISLALSLFSFACFLGFIYEKKASLYASIGLHVTFNTVSTFRILFFTEG